MIPKPSRLAPELTPPPGPICSGRRAAVASKGKRMTTPTLSRITIEGFRSLRSIDLHLGRTNVLIGPNGAGKSNLLSVLRMVPLMHTQSLRRFVGEHGGASALLHYGSGITRELSLRLEFTSGAKRNAYSARLGYAAGDSFIFLDESAEYQGPGANEPKTVPLGAGHAESRLSEVAMSGDTTVRAVDTLLGRMSFFHFLDTSPTSPSRQSARQSNDRYLRSDGCNLAAFLYQLKSSGAADMRKSWNLINGLVRRVAPFIKTLDPDLIDPAQPETSSVRLFWVDERDHRFDTHDLSDGTLRAIALITALAQPSASLPQFISIDEPELGLHPSAITLLVSLVRSVSSRCQVLLATQSPALLDEFEAEEVIVVERNLGETNFKQLDSKDLAAWLEDYSLSELYDKKYALHEPRLPRGGG
jgi:predicted ATPase